MGELTDTTYLLRWYAGPAASSCPFDDLGKLLDHAFTVMRFGNPERLIIERHEIINGQKIGSNLVDWKVEGTGRVDHLASFPAPYKSVLP